MRDLLGAFRRLETTARRELGKWVKTAPLAELLRVSGYLSHTTTSTTRRRKRKPAAQAATAAPAPSPAPTPRKTRKRRKMSPAARKAASLRMKKYWAGRRSKRRKK